MTFRDQACAHLCEYRKNTLGIAEHGVFYHRREPHLKGHILPEAAARQNLLPPYRDLFFASELGVDFHRFFHHLNSSQAMCINLLYPLLKEDAQAQLVRSLGSDMGLPVKGKFESPSSLEVAARRTSFDFHLWNEGGRSLFVEVKYTEDGFGGAKADAEHLDKFRNTYAPLLENSTYLRNECNDAAFFLQDYQILRNLVHIQPQSEVVFLFPRANRKVAEQAAHARDTYLSESGREKMRIVFLEDLVDELIAECEGTSLDGYYESFRLKYLGFL